MTLDLADFLDMTQKAQVKKKKIDKLDFMKIKVLRIRRHYKQSEKPTHRMEENICKSYI